MIKSLTFTIITLMLISCSSWSREGSGGRAEIKSAHLPLTNDKKMIHKRLAGLSGYLDLIEISGAAQCLPARVENIRVKLIQAKREVVGGLYVDSIYQLNWAETAINKLYCRLQYIQNTTGCGLTVATNKVELRFWHQLKQFSDCSDISLEQKIVNTIAHPQISKEEIIPMESIQLSSERTIYFEFDDTTVQQQYLSVLEIHAAFLVKSGMTITLEGHADERGTKAYNHALGERRAEAVAQYLMNFGLASGQINVVSYSEERPSDSGHIDSSWAKNRRVELNYR